MPPARTVISGAVKRQQLRPIDQQLLGRYREFGFEVVSEPIRDRFEHGEGLNIGLLLRGIHASRREGKPSHFGRHSSPPARCRCSRQETIRSAREIFLPPEAALLNALWTPSRVLRTFAQLSWLIDRPVPFAVPDEFVRRSHRRACLIPGRCRPTPMLLKTSWDTDSPEARILPLRKAMSCSSINL